MKYALIAVAVAVTASSALACSYAPIQHRGNLSAAQREDLQKDEATLWKLRADMNTVCMTRKVAITSTCQINKGMCSDLPFAIQDQFKYDFGADGSLKGMVSPEDRTKNAETIGNIYNKWKRI